MMATRRRPRAGSTATGRARSSSRPAPSGWGNATARYTYGPYGEPGEVVGPLFRYTGQILDEETGLYYY